MNCSLTHWDEIATCCQRSPVGKLLPSALYVHWSALSALDPLLQFYEQAARQMVTVPEDLTLIKFSLEKPSISYLCYPGFDSDPHPALQSSIQVNLQTQEVNHGDYSNTKNPFILHRCRCDVDELGQLSGGGRALPNQSHPQETAQFSLGACLDDRNPRSSAPAL